jgi:hypothetical protein
MYHFQEYTRMVMGWTDKIDGKLILLEEGKWLEGWKKEDESTLIQRKWRMYGDVMIKGQKMEKELFFPSSLMIYNPSGRTRPWGLLSL